MIVSNTTPIVCFLKLGRLDILKNIFNEIIISQAVYVEVTAKPDETEEITALTESGLFKTGLSKINFC